MKSNIKNELPEEISYQQLSLSLHFFIRIYGINGEGILNTVYIDAYKKSQINYKLILIYYIDNK